MRDKFIVGWFLLSIFISGLFLAFLAGLVYYTEKGDQCVHRNIDAQIELNQMNGVYEDFDTMLYQAKKEC